MTNDKSPDETVPDSRSGEPQAASANDQSPELVQDLSARVRARIEEADRYARRGQLGTAVNVFKDARTSLVEEQDQVRLAKALLQSHEKLRKECRQFRDAALGVDPDDGTPLFVFSDSLGLPRAEEAKLDDGGVSGTYTGLIRARSRRSDTSVPIRTIPWCQRYFTSTDVLNAVTASRASLKGAFLLVHVGLNDCASRIFSERERVAVSLLDQATQQSLMQFVRRYRRPIIHADPEYSYVDFETFGRNLEKIVKVARVHGARQVIFVTIVQPGPASELHTPHLRWTFSRYNLTIYDVVKRFSARIIDADRLLWHAGLAKMLNKDGIHLSAEGHRLVADECIKLIDDMCAAMPVPRREGLLPPP